MKKVLFITLIIPVLLQAQKPFINSFSPTHTEVGQTVTISGSNLSTVRVFFGGVEATVSSSSNTTIKAIVPAGVTHDMITVLNTTSNLVTQSRQQFFISFSGSGITSYDDEFLVPTTEQAATDICMCDLDGDNLNDIAITHAFASVDNSQSEFTIYRNNTSGTGSLSGTDFQLTSKINNTENVFGFISTTCADLDNDGKPELIFTTNNGGSLRDVYIYRNESTVGSISMTPLSITSLSLPQKDGVNRTPRRVKVADIDGDGKKDLVVGSELTFDNSLFVFRNTSTGTGNFSFASPLEVTVGNAEKTSSIDLADFNNDGLVDIATLPFRRTNQLIYMLKNNSIPGKIEFELNYTINSTGTRENIHVGDLDNDGLIDVAVSSTAARKITIFRNTTTGSSITFGSAQDTNISGAGTWGIDFADMNGDGLVDILTTSTNGNLNIYVLENTSSTGSITFGSTVAIPSSSSTLNIVGGDLNNDGRPDIAYLHNIQPEQFGNLGIILNRNCVTPTITPANLEFCYNDPFTLYATKTVGATYTWEIVAPATGAVTNNGDNAEISIDSSSPPSVDIRVTLTHDAGQTYECAQNITSTFSLVLGAQAAAPTISMAPNTLICAGEDFTLTASASGTGSDTYEWTLPDGTTSTSNPLSITGATLADAGDYTVRFQPGECYSESSAPFSVEIGQAPLFSIVNNGDDNFCANTSVTLEVPDFSGDGLIYQWRLNGGDLGTSPIQVANQSGDYTVIVTDTDNCTSETGAYTINAISIPVSVANGPTEVCDGFQASFTSASTGEAGFTLEYEWNVEDATDAVIFTTAGSTLDYLFPSTGDYEVILTSRYLSTEVASCSSTDPIAVTVSDPQTITFNVADRTQKCFSDNLSIGISSPLSAEIVSYNWSIRNADSSNELITSTPATTNQLDLFTPTDVDSVYAVVTVVTTIGCEVSDSVKIRNFANTLSIEPTPSSLLTGDTLVNGITYPMISLESENFVVLNATGGSSFTWEPSTNFEDPTSNQVTFHPSQPLTLVTVTGVDNNNCDQTFTTAVYLDNIRPRRTFSPNGDGLGFDCWEILNTSSIEGCKVYIFDSRGKNILVADSPFANNCVWDGNYNGSPVPEGVYYFVLKCADSGINKSGSILLAR
jgi:gliding motility-associated-like protein